MANNRFAVFQLKQGKIYDNLRGLQYKELREKHLRVTVDNYDQVYISALRRKDTVYSVYHRLSYKLPHDFKGLPISTSDVIVMNVDSLVSAFYVDDHALVLLPIFSRPNGDSRIVTIDSEDYVFDGVNGTWTAVEEVVLKGIPFYIMRNEHDDSVGYMLVSFDGNIVANHFRELTVDVENQALGHLDLWQKYYTNGEYVRNLGDYAGSLVNYSFVDGSRSNQTRDYSEEIRQRQVGKAMGQRQAEQAGIQRSEMEKLPSQELEQKEEEEVKEEVTIPERQPRILHGRKSLLDSLKIKQDEIARMDGLEVDEEEDMDIPPIPEDLDDDDEFLDLGERNKNNQ